MIKEYILKHKNIDRLISDRIEDIVCISRERIRVFENML